MSETTQSVADHVDASGSAVDVSQSYQRLWSLISELHEKVAARFELARDPSTLPLESYGAEGGPQGTLRAYTGPEIDWLVHAWLADTAHSFCNMHLTAWLGPQIRVPHLGLAFGTFPDMWVYIDSVPRADLMVDLDYLDRYYGPVNEEHLDVRGREGLINFVSRSLYVRTSLSPTAHCFTTPDIDRGIATVEVIARAHVDRWLRWIDDAEPVAPADRPALAARDLAIRRNVAERDPANVMGVRFFGQETTDALVRALWGGDRVLAGPGEAP